MLACGIGLGTEGDVSTSYGDEPEMIQCSFEFVACEIEDDEIIECDE